MKFHRAVDRSRAVARYTPTAQAVDCANMEGVCDSDALISAIKTQELIWNYKLKEHLMNLKNLMIIVDNGIIILVLLPLHQCLAALPLHQCLAPLDQQPALLHQWLMTKILNLKTFHHVL
ncbi:hypothetical protein WA026_007678 [Henosepilachna vigintioctopunctata]|uniref:Uncharacterized protein n=1 Tax=Henosepilachna vigintioctopunctata TaxID=420089 RepID=A0AAW1U589_9CUCU